MRRLYSFVLGVIAVILCFVWCFCLHAKDDEFHKSIEQTGYLQLGRLYCP